MVDSKQSTDMVKIGFRLERDEDDYPPADWEWMWASQVGKSTFKLDNIPFFAKGISFGDIVEADQTDMGLIFREFVQASGHSTVRVIVHRGGPNDAQLGATVERIRQSLSDLGCSAEVSHIPSLIAVDVPPEVDYPAVAAFLSQKEEHGILGYEESALARP